MPSENQKSSAGPEFLSMMERLQAPKQAGLEHEIASLRAEIRELRELLEPVPSLILTGHQVLKEFKRLNASA